MRSRMSRRFEPTTQQPALEPPGSTPAQVSTTQREQTLTVFDAMPRQDSTGLRQSPAAFRWRHPSPHRKYDLFPSACSKVRPFECQQRSLSPICPTILTCGCSLSNVILIRSQADKRRDKALAARLLSRTMKFTGRTSVNTNALAGMRETPTSFKKPSGGSARTICGCF
jgi:hypothetical protein